MSGARHASASAPGKVILFGEHAVVYGRPAIAVPVSQVTATARVTALPAGAQTRLVLPDLARDDALDDLPNDDAFATALRLALAATEIESPPALHILITSTIPIASGLGSGAATAAALIRAIAHFFNRADVATAERVSELTYQVETIHHGTPSGIDNTVVSYNRPVYFVRRARGNQIEPFVVGKPIHILIGDTGVASPTRVTVGDVRRGWLEQPARFEQLFDQCGEITRQARIDLERGDSAALGRLMNSNHDLLCAMGVSSVELDHLVTAARTAGALGAKLSGGGRGGNMIAVVFPPDADRVRRALREAGARDVLETRL